MGQIIGGNYILSKTGDQTDNALGRALNPDATPTPDSDELVESGGVASAVEAKADPGAEFTVTLAAANWSSKTQTVSNAAFAVSGYSYIVAPASASYAAYASAQIYADDVTVAGSMTFHCVDDEPSGDLTVNILKVEVSA